MILVTGAAGQLGNDLVTALVARYGGSSVLATDLRCGDKMGLSGADTAALDVTDRDAVGSLIREAGVEQIYHLAGILSARGEKQPDLCWTVNVNGLKNVLDAVRGTSVKVFWPSSIAVFGPDTPKHRTPQVTIMNPSTMYGAAKAAGELLCEYSARTFGVDVRSVRYPGIISYGTPPGGGTTDFAVDMFVEAVRSGSYTCFVREDTRLPMMYGPDAVKAALSIMDAPQSRIGVRTSYNLTAFSFSAGELAQVIAASVPGFVCEFEPDFRQAIADTWPQVIDDSKAREDWGWHPDYDITGMANDMLSHLIDSEETHV
ncbi:MAG: nucleoside-diphosphate-sugar epimerase [Rhodothermales bacterium]|jgi:nucleoside-diphosphate-sugar epimerase